MTPEQFAVIRPMLGVPMSNAQMTGYAMVRAIVMGATVEEQWNAIVTLLEDKTSIEIDDALGIATAVMEVV